jgi:hypothetical protein
MDTRISFLIVSGLTIIADILKITLRQETANDFYDLCEVVEELQQLVPDPDDAWPILEEGQGEIPISLLEEDVASSSAPSS